MKCQMLQDEITSTEECTTFTTTNNFIQMTYLLKIIKDV